MTASSHLHLPHFFFPLFRLSTVPYRFFFFHAGIFDGTFKAYSGTRRKSKVGNRNTPPFTTSTPPYPTSSIYIVLSSHTKQASKVPPYPHRTVPHNTIPQQTAFFKLSCTQLLRDMRGGWRRGERGKGEGGGVGWVVWRCVGVVGCGRGVPTIVVVVFLSVITHLYLEQEA